VYNKKTRYGNLIIPLAVWVFGCSLSAVSATIWNNSNRLCLVVNFFEGRAGNLRSILAIFSIVYVSCITAVLISAFKIHQTVVKSTSEIESLSERKMSSKKKHQNKLFRSLTRLFVTKLSLLLMMWLPLALSKLPTGIHIWLLGPCLVASPIQNPFVYRQAKRKAVI
jgi:hypothetical protein